MSLFSYTGGEVCSRRFFRNKLQGAGSAGRECAGRFTDKGADRDDF